MILILIWCVIGLLVDQWCLARKEFDRYVLTEIMQWSDALVESFLEGSLCRTLIQSLLWPLVLSTRYQCSKIKRTHDEALTLMRHDLRFHPFWWGDHKEMSRVAMTLVTKSACTNQATLEGAVETHYRAVQARWRKADVRWNQSPIPQVRTLWHEWKRETQQRAVIFQKDMKAALEEQ